MRRHLSSSIRERFFTRYSYFFLVVFRLRFRIREQRQRAGLPELVRDFPREGPQERFEIITSLPDVRII
jgi:hypothetical protein